MQLCATLINSEQQTVPLFILVSLFIAFSSGFPQLLDRMPHWAHWAAQVSFFRWTLQGLFQNQFTKETEYDGKRILTLYKFNSYDEWACHHIVMGITVCGLLFLARWPTTAVAVR